MDVVCLARVRLRQPARVIIFRGLSGICLELGLVAHIFLCRQVWILFLLLFVFIYLYRDSFEQ